MILEKIPDNPMTAQEVLDHVAQHLLVDQGCKCILPKGSCGYRAIATINNTRVKTACAVGCLIPDSRYSAILESKAPTTSGSGDVLRLADMFKPVFDGIIREDDEQALELMAELQSIHDTSPQTAWFRRISKLAEENDLTFRIRRASIHPCCAL